MHEDCLLLKVTVASNLICAITKHIQTHTVSACPPIIWTLNVSRTNYCMYNYDGKSDIKIRQFLEGWGVTYDNDKLRLTGQIDNVHAPRQECRSLLCGCKQTGVWLSGDCTQTDSKALRAIWCLSNSQLNRRNLKRIMRASEKTVKGGPKCVLNPSQQRGAETCVRPVGLVRYTLGSRWPKCWGYFTNKSIRSKHVTWEYLLKSKTATQDKAEQNRAKCSSLFHKIWIKWTAMFHYFAHLLS